jgi:hypothetical protein
LSDFKIGDLIVVKSPHSGLPVDGRIGKVTELDDGTISLRFLYLAPHSMWPDSSIGGGREWPLRATIRHLEKL